MKILLDECLPLRLAKFLPGHDVRTVRQMNWHGLSNGRLLDVASEFDIFITVDKKRRASDTTHGATAGRDRFARPIQHVRRHQSACTAVNCIVGGLETGNRDGCVLRAFIAYGKIVYG